MNTSLSKASLSDIFQKFIVTLIGIGSLFLIHTSVGAYEYLDLDTGWFTNDQQVRFLQNFSVSGNVGIGTTTPGYKLDVSGTGNFTGLRLPTGAGNNYILTSDATGNARWLANNFVETDPQVGANTTNYFSKWNGTALVAGQVFDNGTNVGIGTATPGARLDIYETADNTETLNVRRNTSQYISFIQGAGGGIMKSYSATNNAKPLIFDSTTDALNTAPTAGSVGMNFNIRGSNVITLTQSGNVGIGTVNPTSQLEIGGTAEIKVNGSTNSYFSTFYGQTFIGNNSYTRNVGGNGIMRDQASPLSYIHLSGGNTYIGGAPTGTATTYASASPFLTIMNSGSVGIGTTSPGQKLDVSGGSIRTTNQLISTLATGTAPLAVSSTTRVANLNVATAGTADQLTTARTIGGVSFNGTANINLPGVNTAGNQSTTGNAATATALQTSRTINGVGFNGSANITLPTVNTTGDQTISGNKTFNNDITVVGKVITDTLVNRTVAQLTVSGSIFPNATSSQKDLGATGNRWANLWLSGNANVTSSVTAGSFAGNGTSITNLNASNLASGTIPDARLSTNVVMNSGNQTIGGTKTFSSTIAGSINGNAATATTFSTSRTNYKGVTDAAVAGQLMWKNYGNNHTIFDASASTSPAGGAVNNTNAAVAWAATYPTLMGWNGTNTYGVRVDSARVADSATNATNAGNADTVDGYHEGSFLRARGTVTGDAGTDTITGNGTYAVSMSGYGDIVANFGGVGSSTPSFQLRANYGDSLWFRASRDAETTWDGVTSRGNRVYMDNYHPLADNSTTVAGLAVHSARNNEVNKIVRTDGNGYTNFGWINTPSGAIGDWGNGNIKFYTSNDDYIRYLDRNSMKVQLGLTSKWDADRRDYTADSSYFVGSMGWSTTDLNSVFDWGSGFWDSWSSPGNSPGDTSHYVGINAEHYTNGTNRYGWQMAGGATSRPWFRQTWGTSFGGWQRMLTDSNDPYAYNMNQYVRTTDSPTFSALSTSNTISVGGTSSRIYMLDNDESTSGAKSVHANSNVIGFLNGAGSWQSYWDNGGNQQNVGGITAGGDMTINKDAPTLFFQDVNEQTAMIHNNGNLLYFLRGCGANSHSWCSTGNDWPLYLNLNTNDANFGANVNAYGFYYRSDSKLKKDIKLIDSSLDKILKLNGYEFVWKNTGKKDIGVIAQEVEKVFPDIVGEVTDAKGDSYKTVEYGNLVAPLIEAVKELKSEKDTEIEELRNENRELKELVCLDHPEAQICKIGK